MVPNSVYHGDLQLYTLLFTIAPHLPPLCRICITSLCWRMPVTAHCPACLALCLYVAFARCATLAVAFYRAQRRADGGAASRTWRDIPGGTFAAVERSPAAFTATSRGSNVAGLATTRRFRAMLAGTAVPACLSPAIWGRHARRVSGLPAPVPSSSTLPDLPATILYTSPDAHYLPRHPAPVAACRRTATGRAAIIWPAPPLKTCTPAWATHLILHLVRTHHKRINATARRCGHPFMGRIAFTPTARSHLFLPFHSVYNCDAFSVAGHPPRLRQAYASASAPNYGAVVVRQTSFPALASRHTYMTPDFSFSSSPFGIRSNNLRVERLCRTRWARCTYLGTTGTPAGCTLPSRGASPHRHLAAWLPALPCSTAPTSRAAAYLVDCIAVPCHVTRHRRAPSVHSFLFPTYCTHTVQQPHTIYRT